MYINIYPIYFPPDVQAPANALESTVDPLSVEQCSADDDGGGGGGDSAGRERGLVQEEEREVGVVAVSVYLAYWTAVGTFLAPAIFLALFLMQGSCYSHQYSQAFELLHDHM